VNLPNALTLSRFVFALVLMVLLMLPLPGMTSLALVLFLLAGFTDFLDGYLARKVYGPTSFGKLMDPLADKVMVSAVFISFVEIKLDHFGGRPLMHALPVVIIISREFMVTGLRLLAAGDGTVISAGQWGKHKTVWQIVAIVVLLAGLAYRNDVLAHLGAGEEDLRLYDTALYYTGLVLGVLVSFITVVSGAIYFREHRGLIFPGKQEEMGS
jgi:CDP-diacylglycerol--glycerol-3-phosphate 3-phosphatidyltransferase